MFSLEELIEKVKKIETFFEARQDFLTSGEFSKLTQDAEKIKTDIMELKAAMQLQAPEMPITGGE